MTDAPLRVQVEMDCDSRLAPGAAYAVEFCARRCGLSEPASAEVKAAAEETIQNTVQLLDDGQKRLTVDVQGFDDRVEVVLEHRGAARPTAGLDTFLPGGPANAAGSKAGLSLMTRVDRVLYHTQDGRSRTTLVKYLSPTAKKT